MKELTIGTSCDIVFFEQNYSPVKSVLTGSVEQAAEFIKRGGVVAFPTETVYGLGANVFNEEAVAKIFEAKQRPADNPLIAHVAEAGQIRLLAAEITETAEKLIRAFFPGPLTVVLKKSATVSRLATAGLDTIGIRMPRLELAHRFLYACATPVVAPSANLSGRPSPTTWQAVAEDMDRHIDCILQGEATEIGLESTVVDCTSDIPSVLRSGAISLEQLQEIEPKTMIYQLAPDDIARSPGLRHKHYSPRAKVVIVSDGLDIDPAGHSAFIGLSRPTKRFARERVCSTAGEYAHSVYEFFRECDREGVETIYCEQVDESGIGVALMDRLRRAAE